MSDNKVGRRDFIKLALATGASAAGIASVLSACAPEPTPEPAPAAGGMDQFGGSLDIILRHIFFS